MKAPPVAPLRSSSSPAISSERSASRSVLRLTWNCPASSRSGGSRSPARSPWRARRPRICEAISSKARRVATGRNSRISAFGAALVQPQQVARDYDALDLVGALEDLVDLGVAHEA